MAKIHEVSASVGDTVRVKISEKTQKGKTPCGRITLEFIPNQGASPHVEMRIMPNMPLPLNDDPIDRIHKLQTQLTASEIFRQAEANQMYKQGLTGKEVNQRLRGKDRKIAELKAAIEKEKKRKIRD